MVKGQSKICPFILFTSLKWWMIHDHTLRLGHRQTFVEVGGVTELSRRLREGTSVKLLEIQGLPSAVEFLPCTVTNS